MTSAWNLKVKVQVLKVLKKHKNSLKRFGHRVALTVNCYPVDKEILFFSTMSFGKYLL